MRTEEETVRVPSFRPVTLKSPLGRLVGSLLTEKPSRVAETITGSLAVTLLMLLTLPDSSMVPPPGRKMVTPPSLAVPMAVDRVWAVGSTMPPTLPSAVRRRETLSPGLMSPMVSQALSSTSTSLPASLMLVGALGLGTGSV